MRINLGKFCNIDKLIGDLVSILKEKVTDISDIIYNWNELCPWLRMVQQMFVYKNYLRENL